VVRSSVLYRFGRTLQRGIVGCTRGALPPLLLIVAACGGGGDATKPGGDGGNPPPPADTMATIRVTVRGTVAGYIPGVVYAIVSDRLESRSTMTSLVGENDALVKPFGETSRSATLRVRKGRTVTLIAAEFGGVGTNGRLGGTGPLQKTPPFTQTEFTAWVGETGRLITADRGVASIVMNADADVTAEFAPLQGITVQVQGCVSQAFGHTAQPYLGYGLTAAENVAATGFSGSTTINTTDDDWFFIYGRAGTNIVFRALKFGSNTESGFRSWAGNAASSCTSSLTCTVPIPPRGTEPAVLISRNSWVLGTAPASVPGCGVCAAGSTTCQIRP
jgi:hypothetical protein